MSTLNIGMLLDRKNMITLIAIMFMLSGVIAGAIFILPGLADEAAWLDLDYERYNTEKRITELKEIDTRVARKELATTEQELSDIRAELGRAREEISRSRSIGIALLVAGFGLGGLLLAVKNKSQLFIPLLALNLLVLFNICYDISFFEVGTYVYYKGFTVLGGNFYRIIQSSSELVLFAIGMTFVISATKGPDISVGATGVIAIAVFTRVILSNEFTLPFMILAVILTAFISVIVVAGFNGTLVSVFKIPTMVATLIMFSKGYAIAYCITGGVGYQFRGYGNEWFHYFVRYIPGVPIHTPIITMVVCVTIIFMVLKFTNLGLYIQTVGINEKTARLCGINPVVVKYIAFTILGLCVTIAAITYHGRSIGFSGHYNDLQGIELYAILAVAIGGNSLGGGKFKLLGSIIGAYVVYGLIETLFNVGVSSTEIQAYNAIIIIFILILSSPVVHEKATRTWNAIKAKRAF